ncbi:MAG: cytochrome b5 domain-containing protein [Candidatus Planktophila sp.]
MESLLYSIAGLPVHPLIVHFAVVILPLAATALIALIYMPKLKSQYSFITTVAVVLGSAAVLVAKQSGEALSEKIGTPVKHADYASLLTYTAFVFMVLTLIWYRSSKGRKSRVVTPLGHTTVLAAIAVLVLTFLTGHTGAEAVWKGKLPEATSATAKASATPKATATSKVAGTYNAADLKKHATAASCWSAINGNVYDLTKWINRHPGGASVIKGLCGRDGSAGFNGQHGGQSRPASELAAFKIGKFA